MKKVIFILCFLLSVFTIPTMAAVTSPSVDIRLNHLNYNPKYVPLLMNDTLYISGEDLATMTYGQFEANEETISLTIQNKKMIYHLKDQTYSMGSIKFIPRQKLFFSKEQTIYYPLSLFDHFNYPYTYSNHCFSLNALMPYSTATDRFKYHHFLPTSYDSYEEILSSFMPLNQVQTIIADAKENRRYFSFISTKNKATIMNQIEKSVPQSKNLNLYLRQINKSNGSPVISDFISIPITYKVNEDSLAVNFGEEAVSYNCLWATYQPTITPVSIDLDKSLDVMLMRTFYEYYRNHFNFKDDIHLKPTSQITYDRSDYMTWEVYFRNDPHSKNYTVILYKNSMGDAINYYIDLAYHL